MTLIEALPRDEDGFIVLRGAAVSHAGEETGQPVDALATEETLRTMFGDAVDTNVPLSDGQFENLLQISTPLWKAQWQRWRSEGII